MKKRISDLMNYIQDADVELDQDTPLSSQRIKELTMNKITNKRRTHRRTGFRVLVAVAAIAALTVTVFAAGNIAGWFEDFLGTRFVPESWLDASAMEDYSVELLTEPVSGIPAYKFDGDDVIDVTVESVRLRPESLLIMYRATDFGSTFDYYPGEVGGVMRDGTEILLIPSGFGNVSEEPDSLAWAEYAAEVPPADEIDYIKLPGGTKIDVP